MTGYGGVSVSDWPIHPWPIALTKCLIQHSFIDQALKRHILEGLATGRPHPHPPFLYCSPILGLAFPAVKFCIRHIIRLRSSGCFKRKGFWVSKLIHPGRGRLPHPIQLLYQLARLAQSGHTRLTTFLAIQ